MNYYLSVLKKYAVFKGRSSRQEYWMFVLFNCIFGIVAMLLDNLFRITITSQVYGVIYILYNLAILIPGISVTVRRLHDIDKSGGWIFIVLIPIIGPIWLLVLLCMEGFFGKNHFGANPKEPVNFRISNKAAEPPKTSPQKPVEIKSAKEQPIKPRESKEPIRSKGSTEPKESKEPIKPAPSNGPIIFKENEKLNNFETKKDTENFKK